VVALRPWPRRRTLQAGAAQAAGCSGARTFWNVAFARSRDQATKNRQPRPRQARRRASKMQHPHSLAQGPVLLQQPLALALAPHLPLLRFLLALERPLQQLHRLLQHPSLERPKAVGPLFLAILKAVDPHFLVALPRAAAVVAVARFLALLRAVARRLVATPVLELSPAALRCLVPRVLAHLLECLCSARPPQLPRAQFFLHRASRLQQ